jgi:hypothetical protein
MRQSYQNRVSTQKHQDTELGNLSHQPNLGGPTLALPVPVVVGYEPDSG